MTITALITGGTSGIGQAAANKLAQLGIYVMVVGRSEERGKKTIAEIRRAGGQADFIASDLRDASSVREVARRAVELGNGHVGVVVSRWHLIRAGCWRDYLLWDRHPARGRTGAETFSRNVRSRESRKYEQSR